VTKLVIKEKFRKTLRVLKFITIGIIVLSVLSATIVYFVFYQYDSLFGLTTTNAVVYLIKDAEGIKLKNDIDSNEVDNLVFMFDFSCLMNLFIRSASALSNTSLMELTWDKDGGDGVIKEFRADGSKFLVVLSRYYDDGNIAPRGLFIGGDLPYGDFDRWRERSRNNTGIAYYDGNRWYHIWCSINEGLSINGDRRVFYPRDWFYEGSRVVENSGSEIIIESYHSLSPKINNEKVNLFMKRTLWKKRDEDYVVLKIDIKNMGDRVVSYNLSFGDEPWVGDFGDSRGDVGWYEGGILRYEGHISPLRFRYGGYWDIGNDLIGERWPFTGYANFIEWLDNPPNYVYFSDSFGEVNENSPLSSRFNRVINLLWLYQVLMPGESKTYTLALGMARPPHSGGLPIKPLITGYN
jgi:hypothetical protein